MVELNQSKERLSPGRRPGLLKDLEVKYAKSDKASIVSELRGLVKIDDGIDLSVDLGGFANRKNCVDEESYMDKLKKVSRVVTVDLIRKILESVEILEKSIVDVDLQEGSKLKKEIWQMKEVAHKLGLCGNVIVGNKSFEIHSLGNEVRAVKNVIYCNKTVCPRCAVYISGERIEKLEPVLAKIIKEDQYNLFFVTFTLRHRKGAKFKNLKNALYKISAGMIRTRWFDKGVAGYVKNLEVTDGINGIHPHLHSIIALPKDIDAVEFARKVETYWQKRAKKEGRSCDWSKMDGQWFKPVKMKNLEEVIRYFTAYKKPPQLKDYNILDEVVSSKQKDKNLWNMSPRAYCEVYKDSKGIRWYSSSGIFKVANKVEENSVIDVVNKDSKLGSVLLFEISGRDWKNLYLGDRFVIRDIVANRLLSDGECINRVKEILDSYVQVHSLF